MAFRRRRGIIKRVRVFPINTDDEGLAGFSFLIFFKLHSSENSNVFSCLPKTPDGKSPPRTRRRWIRPGPERRKTFPVRNKLYTVAPRVHVCDADAGSSACGGRRPHPTRPATRTLSPHDRRQNPQTPGPSDEKNFPKYSSSPTLIAYSYVNTVAFSHRYIIFFLRPI